MLISHNVLTRRSALLGLTAAFTLGRTSLALAQANTDKRFVVVILRGALDGLAAVPPYGDPHLAEHRGELTPAQPGVEGGLLDLGGRFGLHPVLNAMHAMYAGNELAIVHAVAGPYRTRSHFEGQDLMESGTSERRMDSGWLNRAVSALPGAGPRTALSVGVDRPLLLRGGLRVGAYAPTSRGVPEADLFARVAALHEGDRITGAPITDGLRARGYATTTLSDGAAPPRDRNAFPALAQAAARLLAAADGPRIAALEIGGWDTHAWQPQRLNGPLKALDDGISALKIGLGPAWAKTVVFVMTEFGRTVRVNGTRGTDHGTGGVAFIAGGAVAGGRVLGDWPGLAPADLFQNRDLAPTSDLRSVAKGLLQQHLRLNEATLASAFPDSAAAAPMAGLVRR